ncbi:hypothetical protein ACFU7Z_01945 [Kitasatospora sp. NPDC057518]|uniref:hypothetical protein n=1 Tax=Kitasatospora sp. NPDC057518 TaxID=3346155 RepID=UPI0036B6C2F4
MNPDGPRNILEVGSPTSAAHPPYDGVRATDPVRLIPYGWVRQTRPGGTVSAVLGTWQEGAGRVELTVLPDGTAEGRITGRAAVPRPSRPPFLPGWSGADDTGRPTDTSPTLLNDPTPAFLVQLAFPEAWFWVTTGEDLESVYCLSVPGASAQIQDDTYGWTVHQGGRPALWDEIERLLAAWQEAGRPDLTAVRLRVTADTQTAWVPGHPALRWEKRLV